MSFRVAFYCHVKKWEIKKNGGMSKTNSTQAIRDCDVLSISIPMPGIADGRIPMAALRDAIPWLGSCCFFGQHLLSHALDFRLCGFGHMQDQRRRLFGNVADGVLRLFGLGFGQLWPDGLPVVRAQVFARHGLSGVAFDQNRQLWGACPVAIGDVLKVAHAGVNGFGKNLPLLRAQLFEVAFKVHAQLHQMMFVLSTSFDVIRWIKSYLKQLSSEQREV